MRKAKAFFSLFLFVLILIPIAGLTCPRQAQTESQAEKPQPPASQAPRPIALQDIQAWKNITISEVSNDGTWFVYRLSPNEGDSEVIIRNTREDKVYKFPAGEAPRNPGSTELAFSDDSKWCAFVIYPEAKESKQLRQDKKKIYTKAGLINLATGEKLDYDKVKKFAFSGENAGWLALHKFPFETQEKEKDKWEGSDLILRELAAAKELNIGNVSEFAFDKKGRWLAWAIDAQGLSGNGIEVRNLATGAVLSLDSDKAVYKGLTWTEKGDGLAAVKGKEEKDYEDKFYSVVGFTNFAAGVPLKTVFDPKDDKAFPAGMTVSPNRGPLWTEDLDGILFGICEPKKKEDAEKKEGDQAGDKPGEKEEKPKESKPEVSDEDTPDLILWHWLDKRLQSQQKVEEKRDKDFSYLCIYRPLEKKFFRLADDTLRDVEAAPKERWAIGIDNSEYELMGNLDGREYQDIYVIDLKTGARKPALKKCRWYFGPSPEGGHFLYYEDGHYYTYEMALGKSYNITRDVPASFINAENDLNVEKPPVYPVGWVKDGVSVLLNDNWDVWNVPVHGGGKAVSLTLDAKKDAIRFYRRFRLDQDEKGIDLSGTVYFVVFGEWTKKAGIARVDKGRPGATVLFWDDALFSQLRKAKKAENYFYTRETFKNYPDYFVSDGTLQKGLKITDANPQQKEILWSAGSMLLDYKSAKGDRLQAALFLPANYEKGKTYPTIVYIYEKLSQSLNRYFTPFANGFNKSYYTSNGYAVLMPDIVYKINDPGMSAVWCVVPALEAAIATGVVDKNRVGLQGHSWGGYQTSFLITQTEAFAAAVAGAPLTNMVSMYSSIYWNTGSANQPIFESSQGRFSGGYWENIDAYTRNSPVYWAQKVKTPFIILHNDLDGAVDWNQGIEYFNTLRRLKKPVVMLEYAGENHGLQKAANQKDYTVRMKEFFDHYLMGKPAPKWLEEGIPFIKIRDLLKEQVKETKQETKK